MFQSNPPALLPTQNKLIVSAEMGIKIIRLLYMHMSSMDRPIFVLIPNGFSGYLR